VGYMLIFLTSSIGRNLYKRMLLRLNTPIWPSAICGNPVPMYLFQKGSVLLWRASHKENLAG
jgi:hypothetical protein